MAEPGGYLSRQEDGTLQLRGSFDYGSVLAVREEGERLINSLSDGICRIDLAGVESSDSVFLALLLSWLRLCASRGVSMELIAVPSGLVDMARVSGLDTILPIAGSDDGLPSEPAPG